MGHFTNMADTPSNETWGVPGMIHIRQTKMRITKSVFIDNTGIFTMYILGEIITNVEFVNNT